MRYPLVFAPNIHLGRGGIALLIVVLTFRAFLFQWDSEVQRHTNATIRPYCSIDGRS